VAYDVALNTEGLDVTKKDVEFRINLDGSRLARLWVSKGGIEWVPKDHEKGIAMSWKEFDTWMKQAK